MRSRFPVIFLSATLLLLLAAGCSQSPQDERAVEERDLSQAATLILDRLVDTNPDLSDVALSIEAIPMPELWERLQAQIFRISSGPLEGEAFLIREDTVVQLGTAFGGHGLTSLEVADLDRDESAELYFTYSFGSGIHQSHIGVYAPALAAERFFEADRYYLGDLGLEKEGDANLFVHIVEPNPEEMTLSFGPRLGSLALNTAGEEVQLTLQLAEGLPSEILADIVP